MNRSALLLLLISTVSGAQTPRGREIVVDSHGPVATVSSALAQAVDGDRIIIRRGVYREPTLFVRRSVTISAEAGAILDGNGERAIMVVTAPGVVVRGLTFRNTGVSHLEDRAALLVQRTSDCLIEQNRFQEVFFGIYLQHVARCTIAGNDLEGSTRRQTLGGNGIHVWQADTVRVRENRIRGHRDGIYFEFVTHGDVTGNVSERNQRYGLHFMFSDDCTYEENTFQRNESGVAVMYTRRVVMRHNTFARNWGAAAYGLLLKDISDSRILANRFVENTVGLYLEGADRNEVSGNRFESNGWGLRLLANAQRNLVTDNVFTGNSFDVGTNSRQNFTTFSGNFWDRYRGYDLDRDGFGDVPHHPVRLFALVVEQTPPSLILLRSAIVDLLDLAERVMPMLTPQTLVDERPRMRATTSGQRTAGVQENRSPVTSRSVAKRPGS